MTKAEFRKEIKKSIKNLSPIQKGIESSFKCVHFIQSDDFKNARIIFGFMPMNDEVDILPILKTALEQKKIVLIPRIENTTEMNFYYVQQDIIRETVQSNWGIYEPDQTAKKCDLEQLKSNYKTQEISILVPGLGFGEDNSRIGRGKGFYDRFLSKMIELFGQDLNTIGVCYNLQKFPTVPHEENDIKIKKLI